MNPVWLQLPDDGIFDNELGKQNNSTLNLTQARKKTNELRGYLGKMWAYTRYRVLNKFLKLHKLLPLALHFSC